MTTKHVFKNDVEVICTSMLEAAGTNSWYVRVFVRGEQRFSTTMSADSSREAARLALDMVVL